MHFIIETLKTYPEVAVYLTLALGFWFGSLNIGKFNLGVVTSTLIAGLVIGQIGFHIPEILQATFFDMFLFAVGYSVGPQFIRAVKTDGLPQIFFTVLVCLSGLATAVIIGKVLHYNGQLTSGLLSGGYTNSTVLGVASSLFNQNPDVSSTAIALIPVAYAVTYPFGTAGSAWFLSSFAPKLLGVDLVASCKAYEKEHGVKEKVSNSAYRKHIARAFEISQPEMFGQSLQQIEAMFDHQLIVTRMRQHDTAEIQSTDENTVLHQGNIVAVYGSLDDLLTYQNKFGPEIKDKALLDFSTEELDIVLQDKNVIGKTLRQVVDSTFNKPGQGVFLISMVRADREMTIDMDMVMQKGDVLTVNGEHAAVTAVARQLGYADRPQAMSDIAFMSIGIVVGCVIGAITIHIGGIPLSFGTSVGAIVAGIVCGYLRSMKRTFGRIPDPAVWIFNNVGLNGFIAVVGLNAAPGFISGLQHYGITLFISGVIVTLVPLIFGLFIGKHVFKFHPGILFGVCAGARSTTAALGAIEAAAQSKVPAIGYTVGYAVSRLVMALLTIVVINVF
jgi:putative transport protein